MAWLRARRADAHRQIRMAADGWAEIILIGLASCPPASRVRTVLVLGAEVAP
jgi:hypothetical protein